MSQIDLFSAVAVRLPDDAELQSRFAVLNQTLFGGVLPQAEIRWSSRMRIAGACDVHNRVITLSRTYHEEFPSDLEDTLKHEMLHLQHPDHGPAFRREARRIDTSVHCKDYPGLHPRARLVYICPNCRGEFPRVKRAVLFCGRCSRGRPDPRFTLILRAPLQPQKPSRRRSRAAGPAPT